MFVQPFDHIHDMGRHTHIIVALHIVHLFFECDKELIHDMLLMIVMKRVDLREIKAHHISIKSVQL